MYNKTVEKYYFPFLFLLFGMIIIFIACNKEDKKILIGKWQSDRDWFQYFEDGTYNSGKDDFQMVTGYKYTLDKNKKELTMYTKSTEQTFYLKYKFFGNDTLAVRNILSTDTTNVKFYRVKESKKEEQ